MLRVCAAIYNALVNSVDEIKLGRAEAKTQIMHKGKSKGNISSKILNNAINRSKFDEGFRQADGPADRMRMMEQSRTGANCWLDPTFTYGRSVIKPNAFQFALLRAIGFSFFSILDGPVPCFSSSAKNPKPCKGENDPKLIHSAELCKHRHTSRHDDVVHQLAFLAKGAGFRLQFEQSMGINNDRMADVLVMGADRGNDVVVDVTIVSALKQADLASVRNDFKPVSTILEDAVKHKRAKYKEELESLGANITFIPFVMSTFGGRDGPAKDLIDIIAPRLAFYFGFSVDNAHSFCYKRLTSMIINHIGFNMYKSWMSIFRQ